MSTGTRVHVTRHQQNQNKNVDAVHYQTYEHSHQSQAENQWFRHYCFLTVFYSFIIVFVWICVVLRMFVFSFILLLFLFNGSLIVFNAFL